jgi:prefoldin subunit 5
MSKILLLSSLIDKRQQKVKELNYYMEQLQFLQSKLFEVQREIKLTNEIIDAIEKENIIDIAELIERQQYDSFK